MSRKVSESIEKNNNNNNNNLQHRRKFELYPHFRISQALSSTIHSINIITNGIQHLLDDTTVAADPLA